jgi:anti-sigma factor ChrR (cupin superfamily)
VIDTTTLPWIASPQPGVERRMLDRIGGEVARATSLVRYAPASAFPEHAHALGEEFLVLDGVFSDEHGDYPAGTYVRNPPGSRHAPRTGPGCTILVKLRQMSPGERGRVVVDTRRATFAASETPGLTRLTLYTDEASGEQVALERLAPGARLGLYDCPGGEEVLVLHGELMDGTAKHRAGAWIRSPAGARRVWATTGGAEYWVKRGHLRASAV